MAYLTNDSVVTRIYSNFRGVDFRGEEINLIRSPDAVNMWKDYKETESIRTRPELALQVSFPAPVYGVFFFNGTQLVHSGKNLYTVTAGGKKTIIFSGLAERESRAFVYENVWYFKDGKNYLEYDGTIIKTVEGFIPTTSIARKPMGGGTTYQDVNMLTNTRHTRTRQRRRRQMVGRYGCAMCWGLIRRIRQTTSGLRVSGWRTVCRSLSSTILWMEAENRFCLM